MHIFLSVELYFLTWIWQTSVELDKWSRNSFSGCTSLFRCSLMDDISVKLYALNPPAYCKKSLLSHPYNKVGLSQSVWRIRGEGLKELVTPFPCLSDFNLPRERSFFCGQRVHLPELGRGDAKHLLRRHRGGAVDGGWCACLIISDSLSCFLANITQGNCMQCECEVCYCVHVWLILFFFFHLPSRVSSWRQTMFPCFSL